MPFSGRLSAALARRGVHYGWVVVAATFLTMLVTAGAVGAPGVLLLPAAARIRLVDCRYLVRHGGPAATGYGSWSPYGARSSVLERALPLWFSPRRCRHVGSIHAADSSSDC